VRVVTWNLWWRFGPWEARAAAIEATLRTLAPDIVCLQETWVDDDGSQAGALGAALGLHATVGEGPRFDGLGFANAVLTRHAPIAAETIVLPDEHGEPTHRRATIVAVETGEAAPELVVVSTHLEQRFSRSATRCAQAAALQRRLHEHHHDNRVVIVGADLNAQPDADEIRGLDGRRVPAAPLVLVDSWPMAGDGTPGFTWRGDNPYLAEANWPNRRLDYVLVSAPRPIGFGRAERSFLAGTEPVDGIMPSDHAAVVVDVTWGDAPLPAIG
jgi:endonuclease/exonuclease/phosphatase family metal-dependent hydrolase